MGTSQRWAVVAVDLDGTLIHGTTACLHLGEWIGHRAVIEELEDRFSAGRDRQRRHRRQGCAVLQGSFHRRSRRSDGSSAVHR